MADASVRLTADVTELNNNLKTTLNLLTDVKNAQDKANENLDSALNKQVSSRKKGTEQLKQENNEINKQVSSLNKLEKELLDVDKASKKAFDNPELDSTTKKVDKLTTSNKKLANSGKGVSKLSGSFKDIGSSVTGFLLSPIGLATAALVGLVSVFKKAVGVQSEFQQSLAELQSITGVSTKDLQFYGDTAKSIASDRTLSTNINETVNAFKLVGSAKPELLGVKEDLAEVTKQAIILSKASGDTLESSVGSLTATLNQFNLGADSAGEVINILAAGSKEGAAAIPQITEAMLKFGVSARSSNISVEESVASIEVLAEKGLQGAEAGTKLRNVFAKLSATEVLPKDALIRLAKAGVDTEGLSDKTKSLQERLELLKPIQSDANALTSLFGLQNKDAAQALLENTDRLGDLVSAVSDTRVAYTQAENNTNTYKASLQRLNNTFTALLAGSGSLVTGLTPLINGLSTFIERLISFKKGIEDLNFARIGAGLLQLVDSFTFGTSGLSKYSDELIRYEDLLDSVVGQVQGNVDSVDLLTSSYIDNQNQINSGNISQLKANKLSEQNKRIVDELNEVYPEFTKLVDIRTASTKELTTATKQYTDAIIDQSLKEAQAEDRKQKINKLIQKNIEIQVARAKGQNEFTKIFSDNVKNLEAEAQEIVDSINSSGEVYKNAGKELKEYGLDLQTETKANLSLLEVAQQKLRELELQDFSFFGTNDVLNEQIKAQKDLISSIQSERQKSLLEIIGDEKKIKKDGENDAENELSKVRNVNARRRKAKEIADAKKLAEERQKILLDSENEYNKNINELLNLRTELYAESEADKILLQESAQLKQIDSLKENILEQQALLQLSADKGEEFINTSTEEQLNAEIEKYKLIVNLTTEQEEAINLLKQDVLNKTHQSLLELEIKNQQELLNLQEDSISKKLELKEAQESLAIDKINNNELTSEIDKETSILKIRQEGLEFKKQLIEEEAKLKEDSINKEIELLKLLNTTEAGLKIKSLETEKEINKVKLDSQIEGYDNQIKAGETAVKEAEKAAEKSTIDNAIGKIFGVDNPEQINAIKQGFKELVDNLVAIYAQGLQNQLDKKQEFIDEINVTIDEQESAVDREIAKQKDGNASSVALEEDKLNEFKAQREKALAEQEEIQQKQQKLEELQQVSSLITAAAQVYQTFASIPYVGVALGVAAVAAMFGAYASSKQQASKLEDGGTIVAGQNKIIQGKRHSKGGENFLDHVEVEGGEMASVFNRKATSKYSNEIINFANMVNSGKKPVLPNLGEVKNLQSKEGALSINVNSNFDNKEIKENNKKMDKLIDLLSSKSEYSEGVNGLTIRKGITVKKYRK